MTWQGINRGITSVSEDMGASEYQQNTRMTVRGELQRRPGMAPANFSPQGTAALGMVGAFPTSGPYGMIVDTAGTVNGFPITMPIWQPPQLKPPAVNGQNDGGGWVGNWVQLFNDDVKTAVSNSACSSRPTTCSGSINMNVSSANTGGIIEVGRSTGTSGGGAKLIIDSRAPANLSNYTVQVPFSRDFPYVYVRSIGQVGANFEAIIPQSTPGCGTAQWIIDQAVSVTSITQIVICANIPTVATCAGRIALNFPVVTAVGATAAVFRSDIGGGVTQIIDFRPIVAGASYSVDVPAAANGLTLIKINLDIGSGGTIAGSLVGQSTLGCA